MYDNCIPPLFHREFAGVLFVIPAHEPGSSTQEEIDMDPASKIRMTNELGIKFDNTD